MANKRQCIADSSDKNYFEEQRDILLADIALSFEHVLGNVNKLNRSLEEVIKMGNDFSSVEALWSQFENVMGSNDDKAASQQQQQQQQQQQEQQGEKAEKSEGGG